MAFALHGPTLTLRPPEPGDAQALLELAGDPDVTRWFSWGPYTDIEQPRSYIERCAGQRERGEHLDLLIVHRELGPAGITGLNEFSRRDARCMVGTWLGKAFWGTGTNRESKAMIAHLAFELLAMHRLGSYSNPANERSTRALLGRRLRARGRAAPLAPSWRAVARRQRVRHAPRGLAGRSPARRPRERRAATSRQAFSPIERNPQRPRPFGWSCPYVFLLSAAIVPLAVLALAAPAVADTQLSAESTASNVTTYGSTTIWSYQLADKSWGLAMSTGGAAPVPLAVAASPVPFDPDLGPGAAGGSVAVYSRCSGSSATKGCDVYSYNVATGVEAKVTAVSKRATSEYAASYWKGWIAFARAPAARSPARTGTSRAGR